MNATILFVIFSMLFSTTYQMNHIVEFHNVLHILLYCQINGVMIIKVVA
jgi:hypothetical protein